MKITINEWLYHYIQDRQQFRKLYSFLKKVMERCDKLIFKYGSPLMRKIWEISKQSQHWEPQRRILARYLLDAFIKNSEKAEILYTNEVGSIPEELVHVVPQDDIYLVEAALATEDRLILTTDRKLKEILAPYSQIKVLLVEDFLPKYLEKD